MLLLLPLPFLALHLIVLQPFHSSSYRVTFWLSPCLLSKLHRWPYLPETNYFCPMQTIHSKTSRDNFSKLFSYLHQWLLKNIMVPFYGWGSTTSRLRSIYEEGICFLPFPEIPSPSSLPVNFSQKFRHHFYALLADNILISFIQPFCSLKHITFVIIPQQNVSKSFSFFCIFGLVNSPSSLFLCL